MLKKSVARELIFFILIFLLFYLATKGGHFLSKQYPEWNSELIILGVGMVFTLLIVGIFYLAKLNQVTDHYQAFNLSPGAMCKGPSYLFQGSDELSKMCRSMEESPNGRCQLAQYNCPKGYVGEPKNTSEWEYTSNSDSEWSGIACKGCNVDKSAYARPHPPECECDTCAMWV